MSLTRREFLASSAAAAAVGVLVPPRLARAWQAQAPSPVFAGIRRNVGCFTMRGGTIGYLVNAGAIVVVDSQFPAEGKVCLDGLNTQSGGRGVDFLINTHHHGDHSAGNVSFRGAAKKVVAQVKAAEHMHNPPGGQPPTDQLFPDTTFTETWAADVGDERVSARHYGRAHTSGDAVITFVDSHMKAGRTRDEILAMRDPLKGFESYGRFGQANPRDILTCAHEEITTGQ